MSDIKKLMAALFNPQDIIEFRPYPPKGSNLDPPNKQLRAWVTLDELDKAVANMTRAHGLGYMPCFCVNPQDEQARRDKSGVVDRILAANCLFADLDEGTHFESGLGLVDERGLPYPTAIVKTPNGCHFYWRLEESFSREELPKWSAYQDSLANRLRGDSITKQVDGSMSDYGQIMRLPSFACTKKRESPWQPVHSLLCELQECDPQRVYSLDNFTLTPLIKSVKELAIQSNFAVGSMSTKTKDFVEQGTYPLGTSRHTFTWARARDLCARGWTQRAATELLCNACAQHYPSGDNSLATDWEQRNLAKQIDNAFTKNLPATIDTEGNQMQQDNTPKETATQREHRITQLAERPMAGLVQAALDSWMTTQGKAQIGIPTKGLPELTKRLSGWRQVTYLSAQTNIGKTVFASKLWLEAGRGTDSIGVYIGTEQDATELTQRTLSSLAQLPYLDCALGAAEYRANDGEQPPQKFKPHGGESKSMTGLQLNRDDDAKLYTATNALRQMFASKRLYLVNADDLGVPHTKWRDDGHLFDSLLELLKHYKKQSGKTRALVVIDYLDAITNFAYPHGMSDIAKQNLVLSSVQQLSRECPTDAFVVVRQQAKSHAGRGGDVNNMIGSGFASYNGSAVLEFYDPTVEELSKDGAVIKTAGTLFSNNLGNRQLSWTYKDADASAAAQIECVKVVVGDITKTRQGGHKGQTCFLFDYKRHQFYECASRELFLQTLQVIKGGVEQVERKQKKLDKLNTPLEATLL